MSQLHLTNTNPPKFQSGSIRERVWALITDGMEVEDLYSQCEKAGLDGKSNLAKFIHVYGCVSVNGNGAAPKKKAPNATKPPRALSPVLVKQTPAPPMAKEICQTLGQISSLKIDEKVAAINAIREELHKHSPFASEPVDCVLWIPADNISANDYNPNTVAPPEMRLLERSITADGYTQPIVAWPSKGGFEVVDGFHRNRVGKESPAVRKRIHGYLPVTIINSDRESKNDRIAATIRHNRARGKHQVQAMSDIVVELKRRNWSDEKIGRELGMEPDEVLRLCQITGLAEMFADQEFSQSWETDGVAESEVVLLEEEASE